ncbi:MAG TPA: ABC transporter permease subunit [Candidatus Angelobacter sp.]|nr:ABC transporter permease subunit [Candidatus Angelobacter sp.]
MMLLYKAWRESKARFLLSALTIAGFCASFVLFVRDARSAIGHGDFSYVGYIWHITYKSYLRDLFVLLALLLGAGGLLRERAYRTAAFTLALPVSRWRLVAARATVGLLEIILLSLLPAVVIPMLSPLVRQSYPFSQAVEFSVLWIVCGSFFFMLGFLSSTIFAGEYTAPLISFLALLGYSAVVDLPGVERYVGDIYDIMTGAGMPYFRQDTFLFSGPLPWASLAIIIFVSLTMAVVAGATTRQQDY